MRDKSAGHSTSVRFEDTAKPDVQLRQHSSGASTGTRAKSQICMNCKHFATLSVQIGTMTLCRLYPPAPMYNANQQKVLTRFPTVRADDWCGQWTDRDEG